MLSFLKKFIKTGIVVGLLVGVAGAAAVMVAGEARTKAVVQQVHGKVLASIDESIEDPAALRAQLLEMEREYPQRISQVRGDLAELESEIRQLERERAIAVRVVALAERDLEAFGIQLAQADGPGDDAALAAVTVNDRRYTTERAQARVRQIQSTRVAYTDRAADADHSLRYLRQQATRLEELLAQLESERAQFKAQIVGLSRQVDAIARNDRLITLLEKRNRTIQECSRYEAVSLDQISGRLAEIRSRQEAELEYLASEQRQGDYEDMARMQLAHEALDASQPEPEDVYELSPYSRDLEAAASGR